MEMKNCFCLAASVFFMLPLLANETQLVLNGGFESSMKGKGWHLPVKWRVADGIGRKESCALVWENDSPETFSFPKQNIPIGPGTRYTFGGWVKVVKGKPKPQVCLGWCDASNKWISCAYATPVADNDASTDGWTRYEGRTQPMPSNAAIGMLHCHMLRGETGQVLFDDFSLMEEGTETIAYLACSAVKNSFTPADGAIRFVASLQVNTVKHPMDGLKAEFVHKNAFGETVRCPVDKFTSDLAEIVRDASEFSMGTQHVAVCISERTTGKVIAEKIRRIVNTERPVPRRVTFDKFGRTILDGRPFFPLGCFTGRLSDDDIVQYKKGPFNFFMPYNTVSEDELDRYHNAGLMVVPCVMHKVHGLRYSVVSAHKTEAESHAWFRKYVSEVGKHPALLAWFLVDEVPLAFVPNVAGVNDLLAEIDPDHPTWAVTDKPNHVRALLPCFDVVGMDPYPIGNRGRSMEVSVCSGWAQKAKEGMFGLRPMWHVPQAFNWGWYRKEDVGREDVRMPTRQEIANMSWQGVAAGANGLCLYSFGIIRKKLQGKEFDAAWGNVCDVAKEVKKMESVLLSADSQIAVENPDKERLVVRTWRHERRDWVLVVNRTREPVKTYLSLPREFASLEISAGEGVSLDGKTLKVDFDGFGYAFVSLTSGEVSSLLRKQRFAERFDSLIAIGAPSNRISAADCGLVNGYVTFNGWIEDVAELRGFFSPPYYSARFNMSVRFNGEKVKASSHLWRPEVLTRTGAAGAWKIESLLYPVAGERAGIMRVEVENASSSEQDLHAEFCVTGGVNILEKWGFVKPYHQKPVEPRLKDGSIILEGEVDDVQLAVALPDGSKTYRLRNVKSGERKVFYVSLAIGRKGEALKCAKRLLSDPSSEIERSVSDWRRRVRGLCERMPALETDCVELEQLYCRSLLHLLLNEWSVPEFKLRPYYATGGMNGGCVCNYLWNYGEIYRLWPMLNPTAAKAHIRAFLCLDLTNCYAFDPIRLEALGPYYPINHEKILLLAHSYVLETGDKIFLNEMLDGKTVIERLVDAALVHDDLSKPAVLVDYGNGNHHLELRKEYRYDGIIPDMNLRRVVCFRLADELCRIANYDPKVDLVARATALRKLVREKLWDADAGWFDNIDTNKGCKRDRRWTMQMFKALGWKDWVLDSDVENALVRHLMDESEFLGPYGLHSLSKKDPAYDVNDVDNGGPGACVSFAPAVVDRLYRDGRVAEAEKIFKRLWWLGGSLPYWGDSHYADRMDYRRDTPLQNDIQGAALAQTVIFGLFGIEPKADGTVDVNPHLPNGVGCMNLRNVKIAGRTFDVLVNRSQGVKVITGGKRISSALGVMATLPR